MTAFRKGDVVTIQSTIDSGFVHEGKVKVRIEPYSDVYANVALTAIGRLEVACVKVVAPSIIVIEKTCRYHEHCTPRADQEAVSDNLL